MRKLVFDPDETVRSAATSALAFSVDLEKWRFDLSLEAVARYPDIEALGQLLHMADERAGGENDKRAGFEPRQLELIESAILATASSNRIDAYRLADSLRRVERDSRAKGLAMRWVWTRIEAMAKIEAKRDLSNLWDVDFLEEELAPVVSVTATPADLDRALDRFRDLDVRSPAIPDLAKVIGWIGGGSEKVTQMMIELLGKDDDTNYSVRSNLMDLPVDDEQLDRRALAFATEARRTVGTAARSDIRQPAKHVVRFLRPPSREWSRNGETVGRIRPSAAARGGTRGRRELRKADTDLEGTGGDRGPRIRVPLRPS